MCKRSYNIMLNKLKIFWSKTNRWHRVLLIFFIVETKLLPGGKVGFQCNDPALSHPFTGDTITWKWLFLVTLLLPLIIVLLVEKQLKDTGSPKKQALKWYKEYLYGFLINVTIIQTIKLIVGSPRPHFFDTCSPKEALTCEGSEYVSRYTCTKAHWLSQSDRSFPSGHTSLAIHSAIFITYYLYRRANSQSSCVRGVQGMSLALALACALSRMTDHRHHWWDVLGGTIIAVPVLLYTIFTKCKNFECLTPKQENSNCEVITPSSESTNPKLVSS